MYNSRFGFGILLFLFFILLNLTVCAPFNSAFDSEKDSPFVNSNNVIVTSHNALRITEGFGVRGFFSVWFAYLGPMEVFWGFKKFGFFWFPSVWQHGLRTTALEQQGLCITKQS